MYEEKFGRYLGPYYSVEKTAAAHGETPKGVTAKQLGKV